MGWTDGVAVRHAGDGVGYQRPGRGASRGMAENEQGMMPAHRFQRESVPSMLASEKRRKRRWTICGRASDISGGPPPPLSTACMQHTVQTSLATACPRWNGQHNLPARPTHPHTIPLQRGVGDMPVGGRPLSPQNPTLPHRSSPRDHPPAPKTSHQEVRARCGLQHAWPKGGGRKQQ